MKHFVASLLLLAFVFTTTACSLIDHSDADGETTENSSTDFTSETRNAYVNEETENEALSKQEIYNSVSSFVSDIPYDSELYSTYNFTDDGTLYFFQFYIFGTERRLFYLLNSHDGGKTWYPQNIQSAPSMYWREHIVCAKMLDESVGIISGGLHATDNNFSERTYITTNGGRDWTQIVLPATPPYLNEESTLLSNYLDGEAHDLTRENGVYYLHVRVPSGSGKYHYLRYSSTDLINWKFAESANINESESTSNVADFSSYEAIIETYRAIVNCFPEYSVEQYKKNECIYTLEFSNEESRVIYERIFFSAFYHYKDDYAVQYLDDGRNYFGYALYDLNGNGSDELILLNDHYDIIAIFTNFDGTPKLIIDNEHYCRIDGEGRIYTQECVNEVNEYFPNFDWYYTVKVHELNEHDELVVVEEYQAINPHNNQGYSFYVDLTQGEGVEISREEFVSKTHGCSELSNAPIITKSSVDLKFVRLFSTLKPYIPEIISIHWYQYEGRGREVYINHLTEESVGIGFLSSAYVTATRSGERAYFEDESICGYLEFGLDGVWLVISESQVDAFPCGAYHFTKYLIYKG